VETADERMTADPSQGSHFFHNITSLGVSYLTIRRDSDDFIDTKPDSPPAASAARAGTWSTTTCPGR
jgi:hypothetical protein